MKMSVKDVVIIVLLIVVTGMGYEFHKQKNHSEIPEALVPRQTKEGSRVFQSPYEQNQVSNTITKHMSEIQKCYNEYLSTNPEKTNGKITLDWNILSNGKSERPEVVSTDFLSTLNDCISTTIKTWVFPEPPGNRKVYVSHVFNFKKVEDTAPNQPKKKS